MNKGQRIPAVSLEVLVGRRIREWLSDGTAVLGAIDHLVRSCTVQQRIVAAAKRLPDSWPNQTPDEARSHLLTICSRVQVHADRVEIALDQSALIRRLEPQTDNANVATDERPQSAHPSPLILTVPARLRRAGMEMRMVVEDGSEPASVNSGLVRVLVRAFAIRNQMLSEPSLTFRGVAEREEIAPSYATRLFRLTFLAPDIIAAILDGRQPPELSLRKLLDDTRLPLDWTEQRTNLGFA